MMNNLIILYHIFMIHLMKINSDLSLLLYLYFDDEE
jgi:hypothetical protein